MNSIIIHISDLHVSLDKKIGGKINEHDSYLDTSSNDESSILFIDKFISSIKRNYDKSKKYLLITGDTTDSGEIKEYTSALKFLNRIIKKLSIDKENILLIPGDHDLNRRSIENLLIRNESSTHEEINIEKFKNFTKFYFEFLNKDFNPNKIIFETLLIEDSFLLMGVNSCTKIDLVNKLGNVPITKFEEDLELIPNQKKHKKIICFHHNLTSSYENKNNGQWHSNNRQVFLNKLLEINIKYIFTGNEHTNSCKQLFNNEIETSDSGCLGSKKHDSAFKIYKIIISDDIVLTNEIYAIQKTKGNDSEYEWDKRTNNVFHQPNEFIIFKKNPPNLEDEVIEIPSTNNQPKVEEKEVIDEIKSYHTEEFSNVIYDKVKELNLFHSGHFHWSETSRAHNWIDISKLIENKDNLSFVKNAIIDVIERKNLKDEIDLIIGLGYEGNIISSKAIIKFNKPYAFLPYSYRQNEHSNYENTLNFDNLDKKFKNVLIITDVVNDGRTIRKLIKKQDIFFKNVVKVYVISLFYTGHSKINHNILNFNFVKTIKGYDIENDDDINNIEFYTVKVLKVEKCPYGANFREDCLIVKDKLDCVNLFYDETPYIKQPDT